MYYTVTKHGFWPIRVRAGSCLHYKYQKLSFLIVLRKFLFLCLLYSLKRIQNGSFRVGGHSGPLQKISFPLNPAGEILRYFLAQ